MIKIPKKKQPTVSRSPHIVRQKQSSFQYSSNRSQTEKPRARSSESQEATQAKKAKYQEYLTRFAQLPYILGATSLIALGVYFSLLTSDPKIVVRGDQKSVVRETAAYNAAAHDLTDDITSQSKFTINRQKISAELLRVFPEVQTVSVSTPFFARAATINLELAKPQLLLNSGTDTFVLDTRGVAVINVSKNRPAFKTEGLPLVTDQSNTAISIGKPALTSVQVAYVTELVHQSNAKQLTIESMNMSAGGGELIVRYQGIAYFVKYNLNEDARKSFGTFVSTKEFVEQKKTPPVEYIDVRIPERAYVK